MPAPWERAPHQQPRPKPAEIIGVMGALAPTADATERVAALGERWGVTPPADQAVRQTQRNHRRGMDAERFCRRVLRTAGWHINTSLGGSYGAADVIGHRTLVVAASDRPGVETVLVQVKRLQEFEPSGLNDAVRRFLGLGRWDKQAAPQLTAANQREAWLWADRQGWVATAVIDAAGGITVSGVYAQEVQQSIDRMIARERATTTTDDTPHNAFRKRLADQ